jgi:hypothetical protein
MNEGFKCDAGDCAGIDDMGLMHLNIFLMYLPPGTGKVYPSILKGLIFILEGYNEFSYPRFYQKTDTAGKKRDE